MACADAPLPWLERLVSLWWVKEYQTLLAGMLALGGGIAVVIAAKMQVEGQRHSSNEANRRLTIARIGRVMVAFQAVRVHVATERYRPEDIQLVSGHFHEMAESDWILAAYIKQITDIFEFHYSQREDFERERMAVLMAYTGQEVFEQMLGRVKHDGTIDYSEPRLKLDQLLRYADELDLTIDRSFPMLPLFEGSDTLPSGRFWRR